MTYDDPVDLTVHLYDTGVVEVIIGKWWNGRWGRLARRDVRLIKHTTWQVDALEGGAEGKVKTWTFDTEEAARAMVDRLLATGGDGWRDITPDGQPVNARRSDR